MNISKINIELKKLGSPFVLDKSVGGKGNSYFQIYEACTTGRLVRRQVYRHEVSAWLKQVKKVNLKDLENI